MDQCLDIPLLQEAEAMQEADNVFTGDMSKFKRLMTIIDEELVKQAQAKHGQGSLATMLVKATEEEKQVIDEAHLVGSTC